MSNPDYKLLHFGQVVYRGKSNPPKKSDVTEKKSRESRAEEVNIWTGLISSEQQFCGDIKLERGLRRSNRKKILFRLLSDQVSLLAAAQQGELSSIESLLRFCEPSIITNLDI